MFWTVINFLILAAILGVFAWKPMLKMLEEREQRIADDKNKAEAARAAAEKIKTELDERLKNIAAEAKAQMAASAAMAGAERDALLASARLQAENILKTGAAQLEAEKQKVLTDARQEIADIALMAAGKFIAAKNTKEQDEKAISALLQGLKK